jgi:uncharacterized protein
MEFEWDEEKNRINIGKHGLSFDRAISIFAGLTLSLIDERKEYGETRIRTVGQVGGVLMVTIIHTDRNGICRIISARPSSKRERRVYDEYALHQRTEH